MTRQDYKIIARALANSAPPFNHLSHPQWVFSVRCIMNALQKENERFDEYVFWTTIENYIGEEDVQT